MTPALFQTQTALGLLMGPRLAAAPPDVAGYARHKAAVRLLLQPAASRRSAMADRLEAPTTAGVAGVEAAGTGPWQCLRDARVQQGLQRARTLPKSSSAACDADPAPIAPDWATRCRAAAIQARGGAPPDPSRAASKAPLSARARLLPCSQAQDWCRHSHGILGGWSRTSPLEMLLACWAWPRPSRGRFARVGPARAAAARLLPVHLAGLAWRPAITLLGMKARLCSP